MQQEVSQGALALAGRWRCCSGWMEKKAGTASPSGRARRACWCTSAGGEQREEQGAGWRWVDSRQKKKSAGIGMGPCMWAGCGRWSITGAFSGLSSGHETSARMAWHGCCLWVADPASVGNSQAHLAEGRACESSSRPHSGVMSGCVGRDGCGLRADREVGRWRSRVVVKRGTASFNRRLMCTLGWGISCTGTKYTL